MNKNELYKQKYFKYKNKYLKLRKQVGGELSISNEFIRSIYNKMDEKNCSTLRFTLNNMHKGVDEYIRIIKNKLEEVIIQVMRIVFEKIHSGAREINIVSLGTGYGDFELFLMTEIKQRLTDLGSGHIPIKLSVIDLGNRNYDYFGEFIVNKIDLYSNKYCNNKAELQLPLLGLDNISFIIAVQFQINFYDLCEIRNFDIMKNVKRLCSVPSSYQMNHYERECISQINEYLILSRIISNDRHIKLFLVWTVNEDKLNYYLGKYYATFNELFIDEQRKITEFMYKEHKMMNFTNDIEWVEGILERKDKRFYEQMLNTVYYLNDLDSANENEVFRYSEALKERLEKIKRKISELNFE
jgi:hypothetical protein